MAASQTHFAVRPGAEHAGPHLEGKVQEVPLPQQILQRFPGRAAGRQRFQPPGFLVGGRFLQAGVPPGDEAVELRGVKRGVGHAGGFQPGAQAAEYGVHQRLSSRFSGNTGVMAATATSIMESSGSKVVSRCIQSPAGTRCATAGCGTAPPI